MGAHDIPLDKAELLALVLEALLYGLSLFMFGGSIWALSSQRSTLRVNRKMFTVSCSLLLFSTSHLVIDIVRVMEGFVLQPEERIAFFWDVAHWTFVSKNYVYAAQTLIGDGVVLYRCYAVWQSKPVMILPTVLWVAVGVTGFGCPFIMTEAHSNQDGVFSHTLSRWITSFWASTLATNVVTTVLLSYRIWYIDSKTTRLCEHKESQLRPVLLIIVDAGVIYSCTLFAALICFKMQSNGQYVLLDMIMPIISITFYMVIIRVGLAKRANRPTHPDVSVSGMPRSRVQFDVTRLTGNENENAPRESTSPMSPVCQCSENEHRSSQVKFNDFCKDAHVSPCPC
ncbi:hypothetical protein V8E55_008253 [Tylopilus felleus]